MENYLRFNKGKGLLKFQRALIHEKKLSTLCLLALIISKLKHLKFIVFTIMYESVKPHIIKNKFIYGLRSRRWEERVRLEPHIFNFSQHSLSG